MNEEGRRGIKSPLTQERIIVPYSIEWLEGIRSDICTISAVNGVKSKKLFLFVH